MKATRLQLYLSQNELAALLGVSRSAITMHERGRRSLPSQALLKLAELNQVMQETEKQKMTPCLKLVKRQQVQQHKAEKLLKAHVQKTAFETVRLSQSLSRMQERHGQMMQKLALIQALIQQTLPATRQMSLLENMEEDTLDAIEHCCPAKQQLVAYRLSTLNAQQCAAQDACSLIRS